MMVAKKMKPEEKEDTLGSTRSLRDDAEKQLARSHKSSSDLKKQSAEELVHELQVHQIELEMQAEDLRKAKFALEESRDRFLDLYDFAPIGYLTLSDKGLIEEVNLTAATLLGVERSRLLKARFSKFIAETDVEVWHWYFINVLNQDEKKCCTLTLIRRDGSYFPARLESLRNKDSSKGTLTVRVAVSDISDIRKAEDVQQNQYSLLKGILESTGSAIFSLDCHYRYTSYNSHHAMVMKQLYGADIKKDRSIFDYQSVKEDQVKTKLNIDRALAGETFVEMAFSGEEARLRRYFEVTHSPVKDISNNVVGVAVFAQDITDRKRAEDAMLESEERYRRITEGLTDYLYTVRVQNGQAVSTTHGAACIVVTGYTAEEFAADPYLWIRMVFDKDRDRIISHVNAVLKGESVPPVEHRIVRKDGEIRWVRDTPINQLDADGKLVSYDGVIKDITAAKQAEEALQKNTDELRTSFNKLTSSEEELRQTFDDLCRSEQALRESERTYRNLYEYAQVGLFETSLKNGNVIACNERYATLAGFSSVKDAIGKDIVHLYANPEDRREVSRILHEQGHIEDHIVQFKNHLTGRPFWAQFSAWINQKKDAAEGTIIDISELKRIEQDLSTKHEELMASFEQLTATEEELKAQFDALAESERTLRLSEERLLMAQEIGQTGSWEYSFETDKIWGSSEGLRLFGFPAVARDLPIEEIEACIVERERVHTALVSLINEGKEYNLEFAINPADGVAQKVIHSIARLNKDGEGKPLRVVGVIRDITESKRAEIALRENEAKYRTLVENIPQKIFMKDLNFRYTSINEKFAQDLGFPPDEMIGKTDADIYPADLAAKYLVGDIRVMETGQTEEFDEKYLLGGKETWVHTIKTVVKDTDGKINGELGVFWDITERKQAEAFRQLSVDVLGILNEPAELHDLVRRVLDAIKLATNADAVGIRLKTGDDFPYFVENGFSNDFLLKENTLVARDPDGEICRDPEGNVSLECTCGLVISGKTDPNNPLFTPGGSSWTNNSFPFLNLPEKDDPRFHPRNTCIHEGYASVALIPIKKSQQEIIGILQINALKKDCFTPDIIQSLELIAGHIGEALMRKKAEVTLQHVTEFQQSIISNARVWLSVLDPAGKILVWNTAAAEISGYPSKEVLDSNAIWKLLYPEKEYRMQINVTINRIISEQKYLENFETVIRTKYGTDKVISWNTKGIPDATGKTVDYIAIGVDVTDRHRAEEQLNKTVDELRRFNNLTVDRELRMIALKQEINALLKNTGKTEKYRIGP